MSISLMNLIASPLGPSVLVTGRRVSCYKFIGMELEVHGGDAAGRLDDTSRQISMTLPAELHQQIAAKACAMSLGFDETVAVLLRYGIEAQAQRGGGD